MTSGLMDLVAETETCCAEQEDEGELSGSCHGPTWQDWRWVSPALRHSLLQSCSESLF